jgi:hypothetical protein
MPAPLTVPPLFPSTTLKVTALLVGPVTVAVNVLVARATTVAVDGEIVTVTLDGGGGG